MNNRNGFNRLVGSWLVCLLAAALGLAVQGFGADVFQPNYYKTYTTTLTNGESRTLNVTNFQDTVRQGSGVALFMSVVATNAATTNVTAGLDVTPDGTTWTTVQPFTAQAYLNGTTASVVYSNWPAMGSPPTLSNCRKIALTTLRNNHSATVTVKLWFSKSGQ